MANEAILKIQKTIPVSMIVSNSTGIEKGSTLQLSADLTASAATADGQYIAGICNGEKIASDGNTYTGVFRGPGDIFEVTLSGSASRGMSVMLTGSNKVTVLTANVSGAKCLGTMLESGTDGQRKLMELNIGPGLL